MVSPDSMQFDYATGTLGQTDDQVPDEKVSS